MTLKELIELRGHKYDEHLKYMTDSKGFYSGYMSGWTEAYQDLREILERNGFDLDVKVKD